MGAVLQQRVKDVRMLLAFSTRKLSPTLQKYSAYDKELLAIYVAVRYFRHMLEAWHFTVLADHKPLTSFHQKRDECSPRQFNHLHFISQFTKDLRRIAGQDNIAADTISRDEGITAPVTYDGLAATEESDDELRTLLVSTTALQRKTFSSLGPQSICNATPLLVNHAHAYRLFSAVRYSTPYTVSAIQVFRQRPSSSPNASCGQAFR